MSYRADMLIAEKIAGFYSKSENCLQNQLGFLMSSDLVQNQIYDYAPPGF